MDSHDILSLKCAILAKPNYFIMYGSKISIIRLARGYTQNYMASKLNIAQNTYSKIEKSEQLKIDDSLLNEIAKTLGVTTEDIKSPTPVVMTFHKDQDTSSACTQPNCMNGKIIEELLNQLAIKDQQIIELLSLVSKT